MAYETSNFNMLKREKKKTRGNRAGREMGPDYKNMDKDQHEVLSLPANLQWIALGTF